MLAPPAQYNVPFLTDFAVAIPIVSNPEAQYLFTVTPGTSSILIPLMKLNVPH
jgi:hypothetical protein